MSSKVRFATLLGEVMVNCGVLEFLTTLHISWLAEESILSDENGALNFDRRIAMLSKLLRERTTLPTREIESLCSQLRRIAVGRNEIAHNPIWNDETGDYYVMVVRRMSRVTEKQLNSLLDETRNAMVEMDKLPTEAKKK